MYRILAIAGFILVFTQQQALTQSFMSETGYVEFESRAPAQTFKGTSTYLTGLINLETGEIDFYVDLNTLKTGIKLRDKHMRESYLETAKFPFAEFKGKLDSSFDVRSDEIQQVIASGVFSVHGVGKPLEVSGFMVKTEAGIQLTAQFDVLLSEFNIERPKVAFYQLNELQIIRLDIVLKPKQGE